LSEFNQLTPKSEEWEVWARRLVQYLARSKSSLAYYINGDSAAEDGLILWNRAGYPVVSKDLAFKQVLIEGGCGQFQTNATQTAASNNVGYQLPLSGSGDGLNLSSDIITVAESGTFKLSATASNSVYLWFEVNGVNTDAVKSNSINSIVELEAGETIRAYWATDSGASLAYQSSGALPQVPAYQLTIHRIKQ